MGRETNKSRREAQAQSAREKAAAARGQAKQAEQRRRAIAILSSVMAIALVAVVVVVIALNHKGKSGPAIAASDAIVSQVTGVPASVTEATGAGATVSSGAPLTVTNATALDSGGKPTLLYIGGEFCPFCAAQRWALIESLSKFGSFSGLQQIKSSEDSISTFTFLHSTYTSKYLNFDAKEQADQNRQPLQSLTATEKAQWYKYLAPGQSGPGYPFMDFDGKYVSIAPMLDPQVLIGKTWAQIAGSLKTTSSPVAQAVNGAADTTTAAICQLTNDEPATACTPTITALSQKFASYPPSA